MERVKNLLKTKDIKAIAVLYIMTVMLLFNEYVNLSWNMDVAWLYSFSHYMRHGFVPYRDFIMITTPFSAWILSLPLYIKDSFMAWNIIGFIVHILEMLAILPICKKNNLSALQSAIITCFAAVSCFGFDIGYNNIATLIMFLMISLCMNDEYQTKDIILLGILSSLDVLTKQSTGVYISFAVVVCLAIFSKNKIKAALIYCISGVLTALPFLLYLIKTDALTDALDIWFGCTTFKMKVSEYQCQGVLLVGCVVLSIIAIVYILKNAIKDKDKNIIIMCIFSAVSLLLLYPLPNIRHILLAITALLVTSLNYFFKNAKGITKTVPAFIVLLPVALVITLIVTGHERIKSLSSEALHLLNNTKEHLELVNNYIDQDPEHLYLFIDKDSTYAHLLKDQKTDNKEITVYKWDIMSEGNIGSNNAKDLAFNSDCDFFIVAADKEMFFWQYSDELKDYIYSLPLEGYIDCDNGHAYAIYKHVK